LIFLKRYALFTVYVETCVELLIQLRMIYDRITWNKLKSPSRIDTLERTPKRLYGRDFILVEAGFHNDLFYKTSTLTIKGIMVFRIE